ncbi:MAG: OprO/OprP family phosphate-selective porin [Bacteroidales bacterium]|nr:OprO/OprP family phosphate-selective porin [Bacteroidales bacterium]
MKTKRIANVLTVVILAAGTAVASEESSWLKPIFDAPKLYEDKESDVLQSIALTGRLQGDLYSFGDNDDSHLEDAMWRRFRFGAKAKIFHDFTLHTEMDLDMNEVDSGHWDEFYLRLTDSYIKWDKYEEATVTVGKQSAGFTLDGATSSKKLILTERNIVAGNFWFDMEYFTGTSVKGDIDEWSYKVGLFSASGEAEYGHFDSGYFGLFSVGHKTGEKGSLRLDYVYNDPDYSSKYSDFKGKNAVGTANHDHVLALVYEQMLSDKLGVQSDIVTSKGIKDNSNGIDQSDLVGLSVTPFYNLTDDLQLVLQYAGVTSLEGDADVQMSRYAYRNADKTKAETAHNFLLGFNWYLYGHKLKWQNALEYSYAENMRGSGDDYHGYGFTSAFRLSW